MQEYRGIKVVDSVKLFNKDGSYNLSVKQALDKTIEKTQEKNHKICSEYNGGKTKILINFNCGHEPHWITPKEYKRGRGCPKCSKKCTKQAEVQLLQLIEKENHVLLSEYKGNRTKILIDFNCGHEPHWIIPTHYKNKSGCPKCSRNCSEQAKKDFLLLLKKKKHKLLSEYIHTKSKILIDFNCGHEPNWTTPNHYKNGLGCPYCKESKGEKTIGEWLKKNNINYKTQYKLPNNKKRYDFFLPEHDLIIEIHGKQHYEYSYFHEIGGRTLKEEQENDRQKEEYARSLGYNYMVVDYREGKPKLTLERFIEQFKPYLEKK